MVPNHREFCCLSSKFFDSKCTGYCDICHKKIPFFPRSWLGLPSQFCVPNSYKLWKKNLSQFHLHKLLKLAQGIFPVGQGKHREFVNRI